MKDYDSSTKEPLPVENKSENFEVDEVRRCDKVEDENEDSVWDGSESELVEDDDAAIYEEKYTGIKLNYELKTSEIYTCLKNFSEYKRKKRRVIIQTVLLALVCIGFLMSGIFRHDTNGYILSVISASVITMIWVIPSFVIKSHAKELVKSGDVYVEIYPDEVVVGSNGLERKIELDGKSKFIEMNNLFVILPPKDDMLIIPVRSIEPDFLPDVEAMLMAGTSPLDFI